MRESWMRRRKKGGLAQRLALTLSLALCLALCLGAQAAFAAVPQTVSGSCSTKVLNPGPTNDHYNLFAVTMPDGQVVVGHCIDYGQAAPADGSYSFSGTWNGSSYDVMVHSETARPQSMAPTPCQRIANFTWSPAGKLELRKGSSNASLSSDNKLYSLQGAQYGVFGDEDCTDLVETLTTDEEGCASVKLPVGTYWVKETQAPSGFSLDTAVHVVSLGYDSAARLAEDSLQDAPQHYTGRLLLSKTDAETGRNVAQGSATLAGAHYSVAYYDAYYDSAQAAEEAGEALRTWVFATNEEGEALLDSSCFVSGDSLYEDGQGAICLPLGTVVIRESKAPNGYLPSDTAFVCQIKPDGVKEMVSDFNAPHDEEQIIRGGVSFQKTDAESALTSALGAASLDGALFQVVNISANPVVVDGVSYGKNQVVACMSVEGACAQTESDALPFGNYYLQEITAGTGYLLNGKKHEFTIDEAGMLDLGCIDAAKNQVIRGDFAFTKTLSSSGKTLAGIPFALTSLTTGERHILVTDENGQVNTGASFVAHTTLTNANDKAVSLKGAVDESLLVQGAGVWFGKASKDVSVPANDTLGALPYDRYSLEELAVKANEGCKLLSRTFTVSRDGFSIDAGTVENVQPSIATAARDKADGDKELFCDDQACIIDRVGYCDLDPQENYTLKARIVLASTQEALVDGQGQETGAQLEFSPESPAGFVEVEIPLNTLSVGGEKLVVFEELYDASGRLLADHCALDDAAQTLFVTSPELGTTLADAETASSMSLPCETDTLVDCVSYRNVTVGKAYRVEGVLMDKESGEMLLDETGTPVSSSVEFTPEYPDGQIELPFTFDSSLLRGKSTVAFETLYYQEAQLAVHADFEDLRQTVDIANPSLGTQALDAADGDKTVSASFDACVADTVRFEGVVPGVKYRVEAKVFDKTAGELVDGGRVLATSVFTPSAGQGVVEVKIPLHTAERAGHELVVFEYLHRADTDDPSAPLAAHEDENDAAQTLQVASKEPAKGASYAKTGVDVRGLFLVPALLAIAAVVLGAAGAYVLRQTRGK